ncbi:MAG: rRNA maturation RNase YbeY [Gammaproteobacteria bacterium]|nr:rRNA maturation RNase YbeY [Gammaproteobacteria bacterium]
MNRVRAKTSRASPEPRLALDLSCSLRGDGRLPRVAQFSRWARAALPPERPHVALSIRIVGATTSRRLNERYRGKPRPTNVLSFAGPGLLPDGGFGLGELVLCAPVIEREARAGSRAPLAHWAHLTVHGVLHLRGYDHERDDEARRMMFLERQILDRLGFSDPYA